jgi:hypothetical protein
MKARLAVIAIVVLVAYAFVWSLMRALDSLGRRTRPALVPDEEPQAPRLRRADAHPDAPSRRPIFAGRDLGEPYHEEEPLELETALAAEPEAFEAPEPQPEPEPLFEPELDSEPLPAFLVPQEPEPAFAEEPEPAAFVEEPAASVEAPAAYAEDEDEEAEEGEDGEEDEAEDESSEDDGQSLARLMQRFESGLTRKQQALDAPPPRLAEPEPEPQPQPEPVPQERVGHRLRSAISDLNKISAPGR